MWEEVVELVRREWAGEWDDRIDTQGAATQSDPSAARTPLPPGLFFAPPPPRAQAIILLHHPKTAIQPKPPSR